MNVWKCRGSKYTLSSQGNFSWFVHIQCDVIKRRVSETGKAGVSEILFETSDTPEMLSEARRRMKKGST